MQTETKRLSLRAVSTKYGLPPRTVSRAVKSGDLPAVVTTTETGRKRVYVSALDAQAWFDSLLARSAGGDL